MLDKNIQYELIQKGRAFTHGYIENDPYEDAFESDQDLKLPQPPLVKAPMRQRNAHIYLPKDFDALCVSKDFTAIIRDRKSSRAYTHRKK